MTKASTGPVDEATPGAGATTAEPLYYLFCCQSVVETTPKNVFYSIHGEALSKALVSLFTRGYGEGDSSLVFHCLKADSLPAESEVLLLEALETLSIYNDPDRFTYDPPPSEHTHQLAQLAGRAEIWSGLLKRQQWAKSLPQSQTGSAPEEAIIPPDQLLNAGLNLLMLLAQCYYKLLESSVGNMCHVLDLDLNQSYFWTITNIQNLLKNYDGLHDFPDEFEPLFADLYPSTLRDIDWEDMAAPEAEAFLSTVQRYVLRKGISDPEENSHAGIFVGMFRPSIDQCIENATRYRSRMRAHWQRVMESATPKTDCTTAPQTDTDHQKP